MPTPKRGHPQVTAGIITILVTVFAMALADAFVKYSSADMTLWQIYVLRSIIVVPILLMMARGHLRFSGPGWIALRSLALALMYLAIYGAIPLLKLSVIAASLYTAPIFIVLLSAIFLREPISVRHWIAILTGFAGVLLIVQPTASGFTPLALIPVVAAFLYAVAAVITQSKCDRIPALTLALSLNLMLLAFGTLVSLLIACTHVGAASDYRFLFGHWHLVDTRDWQVIAVLAVLMIGISIGLAKAYQSPRPQVIATFDYAFLIFASFWGFVFFGEVPDFWTLGGMVMIAVAGLIVLHANAQVEKNQSFWRIQQRSE